MTTLGIGPAAKNDLSGTTLCRERWVLAGWLGWVLSCAFCFASTGAQEEAARDPVAHRDRLVREAYWNPQARTAQAARGGFVPANPVVFREYALSVMLAEASRVNDAWKLGLPGPLGSDQATRLAVTPAIHGIQGGITVSNRYFFGFRGGAFCEYEDSAGSWRRLGTNGPRLNELSRQASLITEKEAAQTGRSALRALGVTPGELGLMETPVVEQFQHEGDDGRRAPLPLFLVSWKPFPEAQFGTMRMEISGLTKKIVAWENPLAKPLPLPDNYFQLLGVSPDPAQWGRAFGYDPRHTRAFDQAARDAAVGQINRLVRAWQLDFPRPLAGADISWFLAKPGPGAPEISAAFTNRFHLQMAGGFVTLFEDKAHARSSFAAAESKLRSPAPTTNTLEEKAVIQLAREALRRAGLDEAKLRLRQPPDVTQASLPLGDEDAALKLPLYDVFWYFPAAEQSKFGDMPAVAVQISALTQRVVLFANNCPWTPKLDGAANSFPAESLPRQAPRRQR